MLQYSRESTLLATSLYKFFLFKNKGKMVLILKKYGCLHNKRVFCYKVSSFFIIHENLSFGGFTMKTEFVVFMYKIFIYISYYLVM